MGMRIFLLIPTLLFALAGLSGCVAAKAAGAAVSTTGKVAKGTVKAGGAVIDASVDAVDTDDPEDD